MNRMVYCLEVIFHWRVHQLASGSKVSLPSLACSSHSLLPLAQQPQPLSGSSHRWNDTFLGLVPRKEHCSSFQAVPAYLQHHKVSKSGLWPSSQMLTHDPRGIHWIIHSSRTFMHKGIDQLSDTNGIYTHLEATSGAAERRKVIGPTISHSWYTQCLLC